MLSNYKLEVENTEKLKTDIDSAFVEINAELKKDDNLIASDLFDVDRCIGELKGSRLKWADGNLQTNTLISNINVDFEIMFLFSLDGIYSETYGTLNGNIVSHDLKSTMLIDFLNGYKYFQKAFADVNRENGTSYYTRDFGVIKQKIETGYDENIKGKWIAFGR